jgi:hypothetical protein
VTGPAGGAWSPLNGAHYLSPQVSSRVPRRYVFLDTEAHRNAVPDGERQTWRLGVTARVKWREASATWSPIEPVRHTTTAGMWEAVAAWARKDARTVVVAHNLAYDLRVSGGLTWLTEHGWTVERPAFSGEHASLEAVKDGRRLVMVDSLSLVPAGLARVGKLVGIPKPALPDEDDSDAAWWERCETDVRILATAYMAVVDWLRANDLGGWARTGAAVGWHTLLRRHLHHQVLVHGRDDLRQVESRAMYAGRAEVWRHGKLRGGPWYEWDYELAYGRVCATTSLPTALVGEVRGASLATMARSLDRSAWLVQAEVAQAVPVLPWRDGTGICWPVGTFSGWWWLPELLATEAAGARVRPIGAYRYHAAPWLAEWAGWAMSLVHDDSTPTARVVGLAAKHWTRAVPGRTAMRFSAWDLAGPAYMPGVGYSPMVDLDTGATGAMLTLGDRRWESWRTEWWGQALPQVLSAVMAELRVRLWEAMTTAGLDHVVYVDTDALVVDEAGSARLQAAVAAGKLPGLRVKAKHLTLEPMAPQLVEGSSYRRLAGVPRGATRAEDGTYRGEVWEGLTASLAGGHPDQVAVRARTIRVSPTDTRRLHLPGGATCPVTVVGDHRTKDQESTA